MIKVVIADDHPIIRQHIRKLLEKNSLVQIIGEAANGKEALDCVEKLHPDVLILDIQMPEMDGLQTLGHLHRSHARVHVLIVSAYSDPHFRAEAKKLGAAGYILKEEAPELLTDAVRQVMQGAEKKSPPQPARKLIKRLAGGE